MSGVVGQIIDGRYEIGELLGRGGMGDVYMGRHLELDRPVAIKLLQGSPNEKARQRFLREARVAALVEHQNAARIYDFGVWRSHDFIVMELVDGPPLSRAIGSAGIRPLDRALRMIHQLADVLAVAHGLGVVHRDIKPENVLVERRADETERLVLVDFGLAFRRGGGTLDRVTRDGAISGTPEFLSPEQARGAADVGPKSDVYSLGCLAFEAVTGRPPFGRTRSLDVVSKHLYVEPEALRSADPSLPVALETIVGRMLEKDPADRPSAAEVRDWIAKMLRQEELVERGRPRRLLEERAERSVTGRIGVRVSQPTADPAHLVGRLSVAGELPEKWQIALSASGFRIGRADDPRGLADVLLMMDATADLVKQIPGHVLVVAVTGADEFEKVKSLLEEGAFDVVSSDSDAATVAAKVQRAFRKLDRSKG